MGTVKRIAVLGSTGSIGQQTLDIVRVWRDRLQVVAVAANRNLELLQKQLKEFQPKMYYAAGELSCDYQAAFTSMEEIASHAEVDLVVVATSGKAGLLPTLAALNAGKVVALANKEILTMAGEILVREANFHGGKILPVDSEHSAVWQCLRGEENRVRKIFLTASGGPFYHYSEAQLARVTPAEALRHPIWKMGKKVTIDSATLMNKGLEVIEAHWLFSLPFEGIEVLVHPQCIVHSMVEFVDGSLKAQLSFPDMRLPIQYALSYPERWDNPELPRLDWGRIRALEFEPVDYGRFPCLQLALDAGRMGGTCPAVLCAADEIAVELFLRGRVAFPDIAKIVEKTLSRHSKIAQPSLDEIIAADFWARKYAMQCALGHYEELEAELDTT
jgi:1-deoxy-D-xylulose-5-phosphate reductoisomerase